MDRDDGEGDDVADGRRDGDTALAEAEVDAGVGESGNRVAREGREEDEGNCSVA